jgi:hypothetical protein
MATELITNGSFETAIGTVPVAWTASGPGKFNNWDTAPAGKAFYGFSVGSANHGGTLQQTIATEPGKTYTITFKAGVSWQAATGNINAGMQLDILNGASLIESQDLTLPMNKTAGYLTYTFTFTATSSQTTLKFTDTSPNGQADFDVALDAVSVQEAPPVKQTGEWGDMMDWPLIGLHAVITQDGKLLTFGTDGKSGTANFQSAMIHDVWDPVTGQHHTLDHTSTAMSDVFCSAAIIVPGTNQIIIGGGDMPQAGNQTTNKDSTIYDSATHQMTPSPEGDLHTPRWYPTMINLPTGQVLVMGGTAGGYTEIFTPGEGWRELTGVPTSAFSDGTSYPRAWVGNNGDIYTFAPGGGSNNTVELKVLDASGNGSIRTIGNLPFMTDWTSPAIMYDTGKVLAMASNGELWKMDISGATPTYAKVGIAVADRNYSNMTVLANGDVLINGGTTSDNHEATGVTKAMIFDPDTGTLSSAGAEAHARVYHGTSILLPDGSVLSLGSGSAGMAETNYLDGQIYKPPYLFDENGKPAARPDIIAAPDTIVAGQTFTITVDNANTIKDLTFIKSGATTHTFNMDARAVDLTFKVINGATIEVTVPSDVNDVTAGSWMLFAWNDKGVPSVAEMVAVKPTLTHYEADGTGGDPIDLDLGPNLILNGDLEALRMTAETQIYQNGQIPGWKNVDVSGVELARGNGTQKLALDVGANADTIYQDVTTQAGKTYKLQFTAAADPTGSSDFDVLWNGQVVARVNPTTGAKVFAFDVTGTGGTDRLAFREVAAQNNGAGATLDNISLRMKDAPVDPEPPTDPTNLLVNGSFENVVGSHAGMPMEIVATNGQVGTWQSSANRIEVWTEGKNGVTGTDGKNVVEVNAQNGVLSQTVKTEAGTYYGISFDYAGQPGQIASSKMEVLWNGAVIGTVDPTDATMKNYHFHAHGTGGNDVLAFRALAGDTDAFGGLLDKVVLIVSSHGENPPTGNAITGTAGDDYLADTDANDVIKAGDGKDTIFLGGKGDDTVDGEGGGYNQVDLTGKAADYSFARNADGTITVASTATGTDTLKNINGFWFYGEEKWYSADQLAPTTGNPGGGDPGGPGNAITGTAADDFLADTDANDVIKAGDGKDTIFLGGKGDDTVDGEGGGYNQVDLTGKAADYSFARNADGTITVASTATGTDTLKNINGFWFYGEEKWYSADQLAPATGNPGGGGATGLTVNADPAGGYYTGSDGNDRFNGGAGNDTFAGGKGNDAYFGGGGDYNQVDLAGAIADWDFSKNADGSVTATHAVYGIDTLSDIDGIWFEDAAQWKSIDQLTA